MLLITHLSTMCLAMVIQSFCSDLLLLLPTPHKFGFVTHVDVLFVPEV